MTEAKQYTERRWLALALLCVAASYTACAEDKDGWVTILDEKSWKDWKVAPGDAKSKVIDDGGPVIVYGIADDEDRPAGIRVDRYAR